MLEVFDIPKLSRDGTNWIAWKCRTLAALGANGVTRHIEGTVRKPAPLPTFPFGHSLSRDEEEQLEKAEKRWDDYHQGEAIAKVQIFATVPEMVLLELHKLETAQEIWNALCDKHEKKSQIIIGELRCRIYRLKCSDESSVCAYLDNLQAAQEQLAGMNAALTDKEYVALMIGSLPRSYCPLVRAVSMALERADTVVKPEMVMEMILDQFDRSKIVTSRHPRMCTTHTESTAQDREEYALAAVIAHPT